MTRQEANYRILAKITEIVAKEPDWRFHQILQNMGMTDQFDHDRWYEESTETLKKIGS